VERLFSADKMVDDYVRLYETLLGQTAQEGPPPGIATA
jgi:hypothetical protein